MSCYTTVAGTNGVASTSFGGITPTYPFTVGGWFLQTTTSVGVNIWALQNTTNNTNYWDVQVKGSLNLCIMEAGVTSAQCANTVVVGAWHYFVARFISATNRRLTVLEPAAIENVQNVTSNTPAGFNSESTGSWPSLSLGYGTGMTAELFRTNNDIQPGGAALLAPTLQQLAYKGPWSISAVAERIVWYKSFRQSQADVTDTVDDPAFSRNGRMGWANSANAPLIGPHPPLASDYVYLNTLKPSQWVV